jgi:hypothetical protein
VDSVFGGSLETGGRFCVGAFGKNFVSVNFKMELSKGSRKLNWITAAETGIHGDSEGASGCITTGNFLKSLISIEYHRQ